MSDSKFPMITSPDGRFVVAVEETLDRFETLHDTVLTDRETGERLFTCAGTPRAEFAADGTLSIAAGSEPGDVQIDPARRVFRARPDDPWLPLPAWGAIEAAYRRGWADGLNFRANGREAVFPWVTTALLIGSILLLVVLSVRPFLDGAALLALLALGGVGVLFFGWLTAGGVRSWAQLRNLRRRAGLKD